MVSGADVLVMGESLVDLVDDGEAVTTHPGGSPMNVAVGLARLGVPTTFLTSIGRDRHGRMIEEHLASSGVTITAGSVGEGRTSVASARIRGDGAAEYEFDVRWDIDGAAVSPGVRLVHTGSIASVLMPGAAQVFTAISNRPRGVLASFDPNVRPALLESPASARASIEALYTVTDIVKMSDEDARWLYPGDTNEQVAGRVLSAGVSVFAMTQGAGGSDLWSGLEHVHLPARETSVADTIGAGDAFMSGMLDALLRDAVLPDLLSGSLVRSSLERVGQVGTWCAAATVARPGADPPMLRELDEDTSI